MDELEPQPQATPPAPEPQTQADGHPEPAQTPDQGAIAPHEAGPSETEVQPDPEAQPEPVAESDPGETQPSGEPGAAEPQTTDEPEPGADAAESSEPEASENLAGAEQIQAAVIDAQDEREPEAGPEAEAGPEQEQSVADDNDSESTMAPTVSIEEWIAASGSAKAEPQPAESLADTQLMAVLEACIYVTEDPLMPAQVAAALNEDPERIRRLLAQLMEEYERPEHGISIREVAGGYKMATKAEHHDSVRSFVKSLKAPLKLSLPALETLAVVAYKQPVTSPEIMEIRGVQGGGVLKTLLDRKLITEGGRKNVIGKPILYKTTKEFLIQFGLKDLSELPTLKEFEEIRRMAFSDEPPAEAAPAPATTELAAEIPAVPDVTSTEAGVPAEAEAPGPETSMASAAPTEAESPAVETTVEDLEGEPQPEAASAPETSPAEPEPSEPTGAPAQNEDGPPNSGPTE